MANRLPKNWRFSRLKDLILFQKGRKPRKLAEIQFEKSIPYLDIKAIEKGEVRSYADNESSVQAEPDDLLIVWDGARSGWIGTGVKGAVGSTIMKLSPVIVDSNYLFHFIRSKFDLLNTQTKGTGIPHLNPDIVWNLDVPISPIPEQKRISASLDILFRNLNSIQSQLDNFPKFFEEFRRQVLDQAVKGKLTKDWRKKNKKKSKWKSNILINLSKNIQIGPFGTQLHKSDYVSNGIPIINPTHIQNSVIVRDNKFTITRKKYKELGNYVLKTGDVIMGRRGEMGRCALITSKENKWLCGTGSLFIRPNKRILSKFLFFVLRSEDTINYLEDEAKGITMKNLNESIVSHIPIKVPSLEEQKVIAKRVEILLKQINRIEDKYHIFKRIVEELPRQILSKAYSGRLVPQLPNDEPVKQLLERIKEEKERMLEKQKESKKVRISNKVERMVIMEIVELLKKNGKMKSVTVWKESDYKDDIDGFYAKLKSLVSEKKIKETKDGKESYLELAA